MIKVLHVEDNLSDLELLRMQIMRVSDEISITGVSNVEDALARLDKETFDCIICDIQLPSMNGLEMLQAVRSAGVSIPFIFLTGQGNEKIAIDALRMGASDYYSKDSDIFSVKQLINSIEKHVEGYKLLQRHDQLLEQSRQMNLQFKSLMDNLDLLVFTCNPDWKLLESNQSFDFVMESLSLDKKLDLKDLHNLPPAKSEAFTSALNQSLTTGRSTSGEISKDDCWGELESCSFKIIPVQGKKLVDRAIIVLTPNYDSRADENPALKTILDRERLALEKVSEQFRGQLTDRIKFEKIFSVLHSLSKSLATIKETRLFYEQVCDSLGMLINTNNIYIALHEHDSVFSFPYIKDKHDDESLERADLKGCLTDYIYRSGVPQIIDGKRHQQLRDSGQVSEVVGMDSKSWMGVPLRADSETFGVLVVQSYSDPGAYNEDDLSLITLVSNQLSLVIRKKIAEEQLLTYQMRLEDRVRERTRDLQTINIQFQREIELRNKSEQLLATLYKLSRTVITTESLQALLKNIHSELNNLFSASDMFIAYSSKPGERQKTIYLSKNSDFKELSTRLIEEIAESGQAIYYSAAAKNEMTDQLAKELEKQKNSWMGAPLITRHGVCGSIIIRKRDEDDSFSKADYSMFTSISLNLAQAIDKKINDDERSLLLEYQQEKNEQLHNVNEELEAFAYSVSHDLRKPIRHIHGFSDVLADLAQQRGDKEFVRLTDKISSACDKMNNLVNDLLTLSRINRVEIRREEVNISSSARSILSELAENNPERNISWEVEDNLFLTAEPALTKVLLQNMLENAWKFTRNTDSATVSVTGSTENNRQHITIADNGAGFDDSKSREVFAPFVRLHKESDYEGTGIGLATVARIIHRHGGSIKVKSKPGEGAAFTFRL